MPPRNSSPNIQGPARSVAIVGGGLAGVCVARALALAAPDADGADLSVALFEASPSLAVGASAVPVGVLHPLDSRDHNLASQFFARGVEATIGWARDLGGPTLGWADFSGVDQQMPPGRGAPVRQTGGWMRPGRFVGACLQDVQARLGDRFGLFLGRGITGSLWSDLRATFDVVVVCSAQDRLLEQAGLALQPLAGQLSLTPIAPDHVAAVRRRFPRVACGQGYVTPVIDGQIFFGATFHRGQSLAAVTREDHLANLAQLDRIWPASERPSVLPQERLEGWAGVRFVTRDRLPHIGQPVAPSVYRSGRVAWPLARSVSQLHQLPRDPGVYVLLGLGARGLSTAVLGATALAADILRLAPALTPRLRNAVDPGRFVLREHARAQGDVRLAGT